MTYRLFIQESVTTIKFIDIEAPTVEEAWDRSEAVEWSTWEEYDQHTNFEPWRDGYVNLPSGVVRG